MVALTVEVVVGLVHDLKCTVAVVVKSVAVWMVPENVVVGVVVLVVVPLEKKC